MKHASLVSAVAIVVIANAFALFHAARNRTGPLAAEITLTNREARYFAPLAGDEDSGVTLVLQWTDPNSLWWPAQVEPPPKWLDRKKLEAFGFDCSVNPGSSDAAGFYWRQRPRRAFIALQYDDPAWQTWLESYERATAQVQAPSRPGYVAGNRTLQSHLVAIDADLDRDKLRARHTDRTSVLILPAAVAIALDPYPYPGNTKIVPRPPAQIVGRIQQVPSLISVPRPLSDEFRRLHPPPRNEAEKDLVYRVHLRYGSELEPWVTGVEFTKGQ